MQQVHRDSATHFAKTEGVLFKPYLRTLFHQSFNNTLTYLRSEIEELKVATQIHGSVISVTNVYREENMGKACVISEDEEDFKAGLEGLAF